MKIMLEYYSTWLTEANTITQSNIQQILELYFGPTTVYHHLYAFQD